MRKQVSLNHSWTFVPDFQESYINNKSINQAIEVDIPHTMKELPLNYFDEESYQFIGTYSKSFNIDDKDLSSSLYIDFQAVMNIAKVYLNGELLMIHEGGYTPFKVDITNKAIVGENLLQVIVDSTEIKDIPPFGHLVDYLGFSGIYREVSLLIMPKAHIELMHVMTDEAPSMIPSDMTLNIDLMIKQDKDDIFKVKASVLDDKSVIFSQTFEDPIKDFKQYNALIKKITRWDLDNPYLYQLKIELLEKDETIDEKTVSFGFRTVRFEADGFFLNNKHLKLIGLNRHQSYPYVGYAMPKSMQALDAKILKDLGCNIVRTSHYMQSEHFLDACDSLGLLVLEEIPGWQYIGDDHFKELSLQNLEVMINTHFNHPWS